MPSTRTVRWLALLSALLAFSVGSPVRAAESDPLEPMNRGIFWFNEKVDLYLLEPAAKGWNFVVPESVQRRIANVFDHFDYPLLFVNTLLQGKLEESAIASGRFVLNSSVGILGLFDPASALGLEESVEDFGQTFGRWGIPPGPYLVLPLLGPANLRDGVGRIGDSTLRLYRYFVPLVASFGMTASEVVNLRSLYLEEVSSARKASLDYYAFVRNAYAQRRDALIRDSGEEPGDEEEDLYEIEDE
jgi:phospholipid-binding lipoprotein MlaA